jgi:hypothetical protein
MATRSVTVTRLSTNAQLAVWTGLLNGDGGQPLEALDFADSSIQVGGTFGAGGTIVWQGSNDGVTYFTLTDAQTTAISKTANAIEQVAEVVRFVRPLVTAGDGTTNLVATLYARRGRA